MAPEMKLSVIVTVVGLVTFLASYAWLQIEALDPSGGVPIGLAMLCMLTAMLTVAGLLCILAAWLSRFIVGREDEHRE